MRTRRAAGRLALVIVCGLLGTDLRAQGNIYSRLSFTSEQLYDANLFAAPRTVGPAFIATSAEPVSDLLVRFGPDLEIGYVTPRSRVALRYALAAERYLTLPTLNDNLARQDAGVSVRYFTTPKMELTFDGTYLTTNTPSELLSISSPTGGSTPIFSSQIALGRAHAERAAFEGSATYRWDPLVRLTGDYAFTRDALSGGATGAAHVARLFAEYRYDERNAFRVVYRYRRIGFVTAEPDGTPGVFSLIIGGFTGISDTPPDNFHLISGGWTFKVSPVTTLQIDAGPEMSQGTIYSDFSPSVRGDLASGRPVGPLFTERGFRPDISGSLRRVFPRAEILLRASTTQEKSLGERGIFPTHRVSSSFMFRSSRRVTLSATPAFLRTSRGDHALDIYTADLGAAFEVTRQFSVSATGRLGRQNGTVVDPGAVIPTRGLSFKVTITTTRNAPVAAAGPPPPEGKTEQ